MGGMQRNFYCRLYPVAVFLKEMTFIYSDIRNLIYRKGQGTEDISILLPSSYEQKWHIFRGQIV